MRESAFPAGLSGHALHGNLWRSLVLIEKLEWQGDETGPVPIWDVTGWWGGAVDRLWVRTEGSPAEGESTEAHVEFLWGHSISRWWDVVSGLRQDMGSGEQRLWGAVGLQGLAPQWFETQLTALASDEGQFAISLQVDRDLLLTNRLILQPRLDLEARTDADPDQGTGTGMLSLRLRYEVIREFAPYVGVEWSRDFSGTSDAADVRHGPREETRIVMGLRMWF